ncbi:MAG: hypothetical protein GIKADHBN_03637 [Phycisphaerales bacterium]|nr:hypothetical protein [Phycisphaerales bacterium]
MVSGSTTTVCCGVVLSVPLACAFLRRSWMTAMTSCDCVRYACPMAVVQSGKSPIIFMTSGIFATALTGSSHDCPSTWDLSPPRATKAAASFTSSG